MRTMPNSLRVGWMGLAMTALALTLADFETRLWLDAGSQAAAAAYLRFQTGAPVTAAVGDATFAFITQPQAMLTLSAFAQGSLDYPGLEFPACGGCI